MNSFRTFRCLTVISEVHMERYMHDTQVAVVGSFRLHVMPRHVFETKRRKRKPVKHQFFQTSSFVFVLEHVAGFSFLVSKVKPYEKLSV